MTSQPPRPPEPVREVILRTVAQLAERRTHETLLEFSAWKALVGAQAARHAQPTTVAHGRLHIIVEDSALLYTLSLRAPQLLAALRHAAPARDIQALSFSVGAVTW